jgi:hypothetical protein
MACVALGLVTAVVVGHVERHQHSYLKLCVRVPVLPQHFFNGIEANLYRE